MINFNCFHQLVGETIMHCQRIENDVKLIYAKMLDGNFNENYADVENRTLGDVLKKLEVLDNSDNAPYFDKQEYDLLRNIKNFRNWLVHNSYSDFLYEDGNAFYKSLNTCYQKVSNFHEKLCQLSERIEENRLNICSG